MSDYETLADLDGRRIRLTNERWEHIVSHAEMVGQREHIVETLANPDSIIATTSDTSIHVYQKFYTKTPVTSKYLPVAVKMLQEDAFVVTAFYSRKTKNGEWIWRK